MMLKTTAIIMQPIVRLFDSLCEKWFIYKSCCIKLMRNWAEILYNFVSLAYTLFTATTPEAVRIGK
jgi:hypothetical protein